MSRFLPTDVVALALVLALGASACSSATVTVTVEPVDLAPDEVVWETGISSGFFATEYELRLFPDLIVLGDGRAIRPGPASARFSGQALTPLEQTVLGPNELGEILSIIAASDVLGPTVDYGEVLVTDVATTTVTGRVGDRVVTTDVFGLGLGNDDGLGLTSDQRTAHQELEALIEAIAAVVDRSGRTWTPTTAPELLVFALSFPPPSAATDEPIAWPLDPALVDLPEGTFSRCVVVSGPDLDSLLAVADAATEYTPWVVDDGEAHLALRPRYPHQDGCPS